MLRIISIKNNASIIGKIMRIFYGMRVSLISSNQVTLPDRLKSPASSQSPHHHFYTSTIIFDYAIYVEPAYKLYI